jgi:hypothetical protein
MLFSGPHSSKDKVTLQLAVYRQAVHLGAKPLEVHDQFLTLKTLQMDVTVSNTKCNISA